MNRLDLAFLGITQKTGTMAFIPFVPAGDPNLDFTVDVIKALAAIGATVIEVGFPFSDPIADGPVIQAAYTRALSTGLTVDAIFGALKKLTADPDWTTPLVAMASFSLIWRRGPEDFVKACLQAGLSGVVVPDLPAEEAEEFASICRSHDFRLTLLVTPTTSPDRLDAIARVCTGFVYVVSIVGITGGQSHFSNALPDLLATLKTRTDRPCCVGFGISEPKHVEALKGLADGVIVGTAFVRKMEHAKTAPSETLSSIVSLASALKKATSGNA
jgi:tryptophan synthase alpha chain